ncbi:MAG: DUF488 domain-containing protein [Anaerolineales bacterium]|nr:DUF488 domain-containing protein [Anaerolineales bacterium]
MNASIRLRRVYEPPGRGEGRKFLVERLWPRGIRKEALTMTAWLKDVAPSTDLRRWYGHDPQKWPEFQRRYRRELAANQPAWQPLLAAARRGPITLLYGARDTEHSGALVLQSFLEAQLAKRG